MIEPHNSQQNYLLDALPAAEFERLLPHMEPVQMPLGEVLYESGAALNYAYFPTTCIISLLYVMADGASAEIAVVGNEGLLGVALFMGGGTMPNRAVVQSAGQAYRLRKQLLMQEFNQYGELHHILLRFTQALITQMAQTAVCNRHHSVDQQLCRWLLLSLDRLVSNELTMTQELIANMLGVRREGVTEAAGKLQRAGLIDYSRGHITVLDRKGLEARVCECYQVVKMEADRLLPPPACTPIIVNIFDVPDVDAPWFAPNGAQGNYPQISRCLNYSDCIGGLRRFPQIKAQAGRGIHLVSNVLLIPKLRSRLYTQVCTTIVEGGQDGTPEGFKAISWGCRCA